MRKLTMFQIKKMVKDKEFYLFKKDHMKYFQINLKSFRIDKTSHAGIFKFSVVGGVIGKVEYYFAFDSIFKTMQEAEKYIKTFEVNDIIERYKNS